MQRHELVNGLIAVIVLTFVIVAILYFTGG
jgi:hypothetical protein